MPAYLPACLLACACLPACVPTCVLLSCHSAIRQLQVNSLCRAAYRSEAAAAEALEAREQRRVHVAAQREAVRARIEALCRGE